MDFEGLEEVISYEGKQFVTDLEGPITKNENARELCEHFIPGGNRFYSMISRYDEVLAEVLKKQNHRAGEKLRLVLPFLKAHGASDNQVLDFSRKHITVIPGAAKTMRYVQEIMASFVVSTSYEHYVSAVCDAIGIPMENAYCTKLSIDSVKVEDWELETLRNLAREISDMAPLDVPQAARGPRGLSAQDQRTVHRLDEILWSELSDLASYRFLTDVNPVGGEEKAASVVDVCKKTGIGLEDTVYIGHGITDAQALRLVRKGGGLAISFNGSAQSLREAEVAIISPHTVVTSVLSEAFFKGGRDLAMELVEGWSMEQVRTSGIIHDYLVRELERVFPDGLPKVARVSENNLEPLIEESLRTRDSVPGEGLGSIT